jgi:hypothetical protein
MGKLDGHCLCGEISYECDAEPIVTAVCHCADCQRQTGTAFSIVVGVPRAELHINGTPKVFETMGSDRNAPAYRSFCGNCGSPIISILADADDVAWIKAGTLRDTSWLQPQLEAWTASSQPWVRSTEHAELPSFPRSPVVA